MTMRLHWPTLKAAALLLVFVVTAAAQDYPTRPVRLVIPFPPGGINDVLGRIVATQLGTRLGKQVIVENRGGAGGVVGSEVVANAPGDGYTLLAVALSGAVNPHLYKLSYDPAKAFTPVAFLGSAPISVVVYPGLPAQSIPELIALARQKPGELRYSSGGVGSFLHLGGELFKLTTGVDIVHVPFRGGTPAMVDVMGGHSHMSFTTITTAMPHIRSGKLRVLGVGWSRRSPALPDVPTVAEAGLPGYEAANWIGLVAPAGTPEPILERLHREVAVVLEIPEVQKQFAHEGAEIMPMSRTEFGAFMVSELAKWGRVIRERGIMAE
jgi:tripartite-type tricarboxylate transporter receptor subunit TctC